MTDAFGNAAPRLKLLIVDDHASFRRTIKSLFQRDKAEIFESQARDIMLKAQ